MKGPSAIFLSIAISCSSFKGHRQYFDPQRRDCDLKILTTLPSDRTSFEQIGTCTGRGAIMIDDGSEKALDRVSRCACQHGGNAIVIEQKTTGFITEDLQQRDKPRQQYGKAVHSARDQNEGN